MGGSLPGEFCTISIERLDEVEEFLALRNQVSEGQFTIMVRRLHSLRGGVAMLGIETLNELTGDLQRSLKLTKRTFGISGVLSQPVPQLKLCAIHVTAILSLENPDWL